MLARELHPFRFRDPLTGKWIRARYKAEVPVVQRRYADWEIIGAPEIRHVTKTSEAQYNQLRAPALA